MFSENEFRFEGRRLSVVSDGTVSLIYRPLPEEFREAGAARWSWRVEESVPATDLTQKGVDDRNLSIYFLFLTEAEVASLGEADVRDLLESEAVRLLLYVWGGGYERGAVLESPYFEGRGKTIALRPSGVGEAAETVSLAEDFTRAFGEEKTVLVGVAVSADSDDTDTSIIGSIQDLVLE